MAELVRYDPIDRTHVVRIGGNEQRLNLAQHASARRRKALRMAGQVYLYLCDIGSGDYKLGASRCPTRRAKQIRTFSPRATMVASVPIPRERGNRFRTYEKNVLQQFKAFAPPEGGKEVLCLSQSQKRDCTRAMRAACRKML